MAGWRDWGERAVKPDEADDDARPDEADDDARPDEEEGAIVCPSFVGMISVGSGNTREANCAPGNVSTERTTPMNETIQNNSNKVDK
jgi:hypothetical protein